MTLAQRNLFLSKVKFAIQEYRRCMDNVIEHYQSVVKGKKKVRNSSIDYWMNESQDYAAIIAHQLKILCDNELSQEELNKLLEENWQSTKGDYGV